MRSPPLAALSCALAFVHCAGAARPVAHSVPAPAHAATPPPPVPSRLVRLAAEGPVLAVRSGERTHLVLAGGLRIENGENPRVAEQSFAEPVRAAFATAQGWRFVTAHDVFDAPDFLGPLTSVASARAGRMGRGAGRAVVLRDGAVEGLAPPVPGVVLDAAFSDAQRGVVVLEPGRAWSTEDGGAHWTALALAHDAATSAYADTDARWVSGGEIAVRIGPDGATSEVPLDAVPRLAESHDPKDTEAALRLRPQSVGQFLAHAARSGVFDADRVAFTRRENPVLPAVFDLARDEITVDAARQLPCAPWRLFSASTLFGVCVERSIATLIERAAEGDWHVRLVARPKDDHPACVASTDGDRVACEGRCDGEIDHEGAAVCEREREGPLHTVTVPAGDLIAVDENGPQVLTPGTALEALTVATASEPPRPLASSVTEESVQVDRAVSPRIGADGRLRFDARAGGVAGVAEGRIGGAFVFHPMPGAWSVRHGAPGFALALGREGFAQSSDDGARWGPIPTADEGAAAVLAFAASATTAEHTRLECSTAGCLLGDGLVRLGWGPAALSHYGARGTLVEREPEPDPAPAWRCERVGETLRLPTLAPAQVGHDAVFTDTSGLGALSVRERAGASAERGVRVEASWRVGHARGPDTRAVFTLPWFFAPADTRYLAVSLAASEALFVRCGAGPAGMASRCDLVRVTPPARAELLATLPVGTFRVARDGAAVTVLAASTTERRLTSVRGGVAHTESIVLDDDPALGVAGPYALGDEAGIVRVRNDGAVVLMPAGGPARALAGHVTRDACGIDARGDFALPATGALAPGDGGTRALELTAHYGLAGDALCVRGIDGTVTQLGTAGWIDARSALMTSELTGTARLLEGMAGVRCTRPGPP